MGALNPQRFFKSLEPEGRHAVERLPAVSGARGIAYFARVSSAAIIFALSVSRSGRLRKLFHKAVFTRGGQHLAYGALFEHLARSVARLEGAHRVARRCGCAVGELQDDSVAQRQVRVVEGLAEHVPAAGKRRPRILGILHALALRVCIGIGFAACVLLRPLPHCDEEDARHHYDGARPLGRGERRVVMRRPAYAGHAQEQPHEQRRPERIHTVAGHAQRRAAHGIALVPKRVRRHGEQAGQGEHRHGGAGKGRCGKGRQARRVAPDRRQNGKEHRGLQDTRGELSDGDAYAVVDERGTKARNAALEPPANRGQQGEGAPHDGAGTHGREARAAYDGARAKAHRNARGRLGAQPLPEHDPPQDRPHGHVEGRYGHDHARVAGARGGVQRHHVAGGRERPAYGRTQHHDRARSGADRAHKVTHLLVFRAHGKRPDAAEQVVQAGGEGRHGERRGDGGEAGVDAACRQQRDRGIS